MKTLLDPGVVVHGRLYGDLRCTVGQFIGSGGQGEVYSVRLEGNGRTDVGALKWYTQAWANDDQRRLLYELTEMNPPHKSFLWPKDVVVRLIAPVSAI